MNSYETIKDGLNHICNPNTPEARAFFEEVAKRRAAQVARQVVRNEIKADNMTTNAIGKAFRVKGRNGTTYTGVISRCERAGVVGRYHGFEIYLKNGEYENGPHIVTQLPR